MSFKIILNSKYQELVNENTDIIESRGLEDINYRKNFNPRISGIIFSKEDSKFFAVNCTVLIKTDSC